MSLSVLAGSHHRCKGHSGTAQDKSFEQRVEPVEPLGGSIIPAWVSLAVTVRIDIYFVVDILSFSDEISLPY